MIKIAALIPAYNPSGQLVTIVRELSATVFSSIIVVNDGSIGACDPTFREIESIEKVTVLRHAVNLGKGAALKTGLNHVYCHFPEHTGVVTIDSDGQHLAVDALNIAQTLQDNPDSLVIGVRKFDKDDKDDKDVPLRSMLGNVLTKKLFRFLVGQKLTDTQSGLRGIPRGFVTKLLKIDSNGYEYELEMLLACKYSNRTIVEKEINTVYLEGNKSSHFNPLLDSMKIYFVLFRFTLASLIAAVIDYTVFFLAYRLSFSLAVSQTSARLVSMLFNYSAVKRLVFYSDQKQKKTFPKYAALVLISGSISLLLINLIVSYTPLKILPAKIISELLIFIANFAIQRDFIFTKNNRTETVTNWNNYYSKLYKTATFTRKITERTLLNLIGRYVTSEIKNPLTAELRGGANSCFFDTIKSEINPAQYHVIDNYQPGLDRLSERIGKDSSIFLQNANVLDIGTTLRFDLVFSVGLIKHFSIEDTRKAIGDHFKLLKPGGIAIISFSTSTFLYRISRCIYKLSGLWIFHDELPLTKEEVSNAVSEYGTIVFDKIIWPILLTQRIMVVKFSSREILQ